MAGGAGALCARLHTGMSKFVGDFVFSNKHQKFPDFVFDFIFVCLLLLFYRNVNDSVDCASLKMKKRMIHLNIGLSNHRSVRDLQCALYQRRVVGLIVSKISAKKSTSQCR